MGDPSLLGSGEFLAGDCGDYLTGTDTPGLASTIVRRRHTDTSKSAAFGDERQPFPDSLLQRLK